MIENIDKQLTKNNGQWTIVQIAYPKHFVNRCANKRYKVRARFKEVV